MKLNVHLGTVLPSKAIDRTEFSTSQSRSRSVSMAFFTVLETVLSSMSFVTYRSTKPSTWGKNSGVNFKLQSTNMWKRIWTSLREFILALKWGVLSIRRRMSSRRSSTTFTSSRWKRMQRSLMADKSSGILTKRFREKETYKGESQSLKHYRNLKQDDFSKI